MNLAMKALIVLSAALPMGCLFGGGEEDYPNLNKSALVGCWSDVRPAEGRCEERCFSAGGRQYDLVLSQSVEPGVQNVYETVGTYTVSGSIIASDLVSAYSVKPEDTIQFSFRAHYTLSGGILSKILPGGNDRLSFSRSDSTRNCRPHWRIFKKPSDWDLD